MKYCAYSIVGRSVGCPESCTNPQSQSSHEHSYADQSSSAGKLLGINCFVSLRSGQCTKGTGAVPWGHPDLVSQRNSGPLHHFFFKSCTAILWETSSVALNILEHWLGLENLLCIFPILEDTISLKLPDVLWNHANTIFVLTMKNMTSLKSTLNSSWMVLAWRDAASTAAWSCRCGMVNCSVIPFYNVGTGSEGFSHLLSGTNCKQGWKEGHMIDFQYLLEQSESWSWIVHPW